MNGEILLYQTEDGKTKIEVILENETMWLNQYQLADLFQTDRTSIVRHIRNIYSTNELSEEATSQNYVKTKQEGKRTVTRNIIYYNFIMIIAIGFRVNSRIGTLFRNLVINNVTKRKKKGDYLDVFDKLFNLKKITKEDFYHVYLMQDTDTNYFKIGVSKQPKYREKTLQAEKPTINLIASTVFENRQTAFKIEKYFHLLFNNKRIRGEWFCLNNDDVNFFINSASS